MSGNEASSPRVEGSSSEDDSNDAQSEPELMIATREKRKTAGNRYSQVVAQEQIDEDAEDDVALLFAEAEGEDEEYNSDEADDEADMSSSDDDDQGPNAAPDNEDGEQELQKQAKVERQKKRKADMAMTTMSAIRKKPKIDPTALHRAPDRPKPTKRKERTSWLPEQANTPGRTSLRKQTVAHREVLLERLKENEEIRLKNKAQREKKEKQKQANAPKELTQADRLAEAEKNERRNAKSLNRWETMEKQRAEEQAAKLAALKDRKLDGAVLTSHSAAYIYHGLKPENWSSGPNGSEDQVHKNRGPKPKLPILQQSLLQQPQFTSPISVSGATTLPQVSALVTATVPSSSLNPTQVSIAVPKTSGWLAGIHEYASMPPIPENVESGQAQPTIVLSKSDIEPSVTTTPTDITQANAESISIDSSNVPVSDGKAVSGVKTEAVGNSATESLQLPTNNAEIQNSNTDNIAKPSVQVTTVLPQLLPARTIPQSIPFQPPPHLVQAQQTSSENTASQSPAPSTVSSQPVVEVLSARNLLILQDFEDLTSDERQAYSALYGTKRLSKPIKHIAELCTITGLPSKYRDPGTGVSYANSAAYKKLKELQQHKYVWSSMLGCYIGKTNIAARGVPEGFLPT